MPLCKIPGNIPSYRSASAVFVIISRTTYNKTISNNEYQKQNVWSTRNGVAALVGIPMDCSPPLLSIFSVVRPTSAVSPRSVAVAQLEVRKTGSHCHHWTGFDNLSPYTSAPFLRVPPVSTEIHQQQQYLSAKRNWLSIE